MCTESRETDASAVACTVAVPVAISGAVSQTDSHSRKENSDTLRGEMVVNRLLAPVSLKVSNSIWLFLESQRGLRVVSLLTC